MSRWTVPLFAFLFITLTIIAVILAAYIHSAPPTIPLSTTPPSAPVAPGAPAVWQMTMESSGVSTIGNFRNPDFNIQVGGGAMGISEGNGTATLSAHATVTLGPTNTQTGPAPILEAIVKSNMYAMLTPAGDIFVAEPQGALTAEDRGLKVVAEKPVISKQTTDYQGRHMVTLTMTATASYLGHSKDMNSKIIIYATDIVAHPPPLPPPPFPKPPTIPPGVGHGWQVVVNSISNHSQRGMPVANGTLRKDARLDIDVIDYTPDGEHATVVVTQYAIITDSSGKKITENTVQIRYDASAIYLGDIDFGSPNGSTTADSLGLKLQLAPPEVSPTTIDSLGRHRVTVKFTSNSNYSSNQNVPVTGSQPVEAEIEILTVPTTPLTAPPAATSPTSSVPAP